MRRRREIRQPDENMPKTRASAKSIGSTFYFTGKPCLRGHVAVRITSSGKCAQCDSDRKKDAYTADPEGNRKRARDWRRNNPEKAKENNKKWADENRDYRREYNRDYQREWRAENPDKDRTIKKRWEEANPDKSAESKAKWREENLEHARKLAREAAQRRYAADPEKARERNRKRRAENPDKEREYQRSSDKKRLSTPKGRLTASVKAGVIRGIEKGTKAGRSTFDLLGYTAEELKLHLEKLFLPGMTWDNYGEWHIDHIIPLSAHNYETPDDPDFKRAWALTNLQPLWAFDNISKHAKLEKPFQPSLLLRPSTDDIPPQKEETA